MIAMNRKRVISVLLFSLCLIGCLYQVSDISSVYFLFQTKTSVEINIVTSLPMPILSTCWDLRNVMNFDVISHDFGFKIPKFDSLSDYYSILNNLTIKQIFNYTPSVDSTIDACIIRYPYEYAYRTPSYNSSECYDRFTIEKYMLRMDVCYMMTMKEDRRSHILKQTMAPSTGGMMYRIYLSSLFNSSYWHNAIIHSKESSMLYDAAYSPKRYFDNGDQSTALDVTFYPIEKHYLPPPYTTKCKYINHTSGAEEILGRVRGKIIADLGLVDTLAPVSIPYDLRMVTTDMLRNTTFQSIFRSYAEEAEDPPKICKFKCMVTRTNAYRADEPFISIFWPLDAMTHINHFPRYNTTDYIIYVSSSIGIWFGLSVFTLSNMLKDLVVKGTNTAAIYGRNHTRNSVSSATYGRNRIDFNLHSIRHSIRWHMVSIDRLTREVNLLKRRRFLIRANEHVI